MGSLTRRREMTKKNANEKKEKKCSYKTTSAKTTCTMQPIWTD
jgi:hypothetical protein